MEGKQTVTAYMIAFDDQHQELVFPVDSGDLRPGDLLLLQAGERVPADCKLLWGELVVEDTAVAKPPQVIKSGGLIQSGSAKAYVTISETEPG